jgi:hypothetical protein
MTNDIAEFLASWRARITPEQVHLPTYGRRRVDAGLNLTVYTAQAGSASQQALDLLASWTATPDRAKTAEAGDQATSR